jgi:hypothetical protein
LSKLIPFRAARYHDAAAYLLALSTRFARTSKAKPWLPPRDPEHLGNLLQRLARSHPAIVFVIANLVAEILRQVEHPK